MSTTHEEVALQLSTMALASQSDSESQIRAKATSILSAPPPNVIAVEIRSPEPTE